MIRYESMASDWISNKDYKFIFSRTPRLCVDLVVKNEDGNIVLVKRKTAPHVGKWHLAGGRVHFRESISKSIRRVAKDELNLTISSSHTTELVGYMEFPRDNGFHSVSLVFLVKINTKKIEGILNDDIRLFDGIPSNCHPIHKRFLQNLGK